MMNETGRGNAEAIFRAVVGYAGAMEERRIVDEMVRNGAIDDGVDLDAIYDGEIVPRRKAPGGSTSRNARQFALDDICRSNQFTGDGVCAAGHNAEAN